MQAGPDAPPVQSDDSHQAVVHSSSRVSPQLIAIYERYLGTLPAGSGACGDSSRVESNSDHWVVVDAVAHNNAAFLLEQLTAIGLAGAHLAPPVVSGYLPVCAIPHLETCCPELKSVRESVATTQRP